MQTRTLLRLALVTSIVGLILLFFLSENLEPPLMPIKEISEKYFDSYVKVAGEITNVKETKGLYILTVEDATDEIEVVIFKDKNVTFSEDTQVEVIGKVTKYWTRLQIEAVEVRAIENVA